MIFWNDTGPSSRFKKIWNLMKRSTWLIPVMASSFVCPSFHNTIAQTEWLKQGGGFIFCFRGSNSKIEGWLMVRPLFLADSCPCTASSRGLSPVHMQKELPGVSSTEGHQSYWIRASLLGHHLTLITSVKSSSPIQSHWGSGLPHMNFGKGETQVSL